MLNSTKTWQERFDEQFIDVIVFDSKGSYYKKFKEGVELINIYKFISDLRKRDMEALIKMLPKKKLGHINQEGFCDNCGYKICRCYQINSIVDTFKKLIKDYYEN